MMPAVHVSLGPYSNELLFDLSEGGFSIYGRVPPPGRDGFPISLSLPGAPNPIQARGEIAWSSKAKNRTGIRFTELSRNSLSQLQNWMETNLPAAAPYKEYYDIEIPGRVDQLVDAIREGAFDTRLVRRSLIIGAVLVAAFLSGLVLSDYRWRSSETTEASNTAAETPAGVSSASATSANASSSPAASTATPKTSPQSVVIPAPPASPQESPAELRAQTSTIPPSAAAAAEAPAPNASIARTSSSHEFIVQVGAMKDRRNADALSASLQQKGFAVVRSRIATDGVYRVAAGPYPDLAAANQAKHQLDAQNLPGFVTRFVQAQ
jgi:cell division septation protein DedD